MPRGRPRKKVDVVPEAHTGAFPISSSPEGSSPQGDSGSCFSPSASSGAADQGVPAPAAFGLSPEVSGGSLEATALLRIDIPGLPAKKVKGEWNPEYFAELLDMPLRRAVQCLQSGEKIDFPFAQFQKGVMDAAKMVGITERQVMDRRTEAQRVEEVWEKISSDPEAILGISDDDLTAMDNLIGKIEEKQNAADEQVREQLLKKLEKADEEKEERSHIAAEARAAKERYKENRSPKAWRRRIQRVLRLRQRARMPVPPAGKGAEFGGWTGNQHTESENPGLYKYALEAAHPLRFMVYVGRTGMDMGERFEKKRQEPADLVFDVGPHHAKFCATLWCHRNGAEPVWDAKLMKHVYQTGVVEYDGSLQVMAIGHGKSELAIHLCGLEMGLRPRTQGLYLHAATTMAMQNLAAIKRFVEPDTDPICQRYKSIFPCKKASKHNDATRIRLDVKNPPKSPTFTAAGVDTARLGIDADFQVWDDVVPQSDAHEPTERKKRAELLSGTFASRKRSRKAFTLVIGTLWHRDDALMRMIDAAKSANRTNGQSGIVYGVCIQRCGGPKPTTFTDPWQPLWPGQYDAKRLQAKYRELGPALYAAAMMAEPRADEQRIVKKLRLYDPSTPEHDTFARISTNYISLDPAATRNRDSDKAGVVFAGFGDVRVKRMGEDGVEYTDIEKRIRLYDYREIHATQSDLTEYTLNFALHQRVDQIIVEAVSGFRGIVEMFENKGVSVIRKDPKGKDKEQRLRGVAPMLEDVSADLGMRSVVEWPGKYNERGELVLDERFKGLAEQVLDFGVCADDHGLDALVYLLGELSPDVGVGRGMISEAAKRVEMVSKDPRIAALMRRIMNKDGGKTADQEDCEWLERNWN